MLADQFETMHKYVGEPGMLEAVNVYSQMVKDAHRFTLDRAATMMAMNVSTGSIANFVKTLPICRLPYENMWVECAFRDRQDWLSEAQKHGYDVKDEPTASPPGRLGFLLNEITNPVTGQRYLTAHLAWSHPDNNDGVAIARKILMLDMSDEPSVEDRGQFKDNWKYESSKPPEGPEYEAFINMSRRIGHIIPHMLKPYWHHVRASGIEKRITQMAEYDLLGEWRFVLALLMLINSRNLMKMGEAETYDKLNRARTRSGKPPLLSHRPITLSLSKVQRQRIATGYAGPGARSAPNEPHWVFGHFKVRKTGMYWWSFHTRGGEVAARARDHTVTA